ncbi:alpha/beta hydrolase [Eudoraea sp.]
MKKNLFSSGVLLLMLFCLCTCGNRKSKEDKDHVISELKTVFINGESIHYIDKGKGDPIILVHGGLGDYRTWGAQMDTFAQNHRAIAYSRRFAYPNNQIIGDSSDYSGISHEKDLAELVKSLNLGPVHLVGHSGGGRVALLTTLDHPELVRSLTLGEPALMSMLENVPGGDTMPNKLGKAWELMTEEFKNNNNEKAVTIFIGAVTDDSLYFSKLPKRDQKIMMDNTLDFRESPIRKSSRRSITCDDLKKIKAPVLLLKGDISPLFLTSMVDELDRCLRDKELVTLPNTSHGLPFENPAEFNKIVLGYINKH